MPAAAEETIHFDGRAKDILASRLPDDIH